jgi:hypothetical protein
VLRVLRVERRVLAVAVRTVVLVRRSWIVESRAERVEGVRVSVGSWFIVSKGAGVCRFEKGGTWTAW